MLIKISLALFTIFIFQAFACDSLEKSMPSVPFAKINLSVEGCVKNSVDDVCGCVTTLDYNNRFDEKKYRKYLESVFFESYASNIYEIYENINTIDFLLEDYINNNVDEFKGLLPSEAKSKLMNESSGENMPVACNLEHMAENIPCKNQHVLSMVKKLSSDFKVMMSRNSQDSVKCPVRSNEGIIDRCSNKRKSCHISDDVLRGLYYKKSLSMMKDKFVAISKETGIKTSSEDVLSSMGDKIFELMYVDIDKLDDLTKMSSDLEMIRSFYDTDPHVFKTIEQVVDPSRDQYVNQKAMIGSSIEKAVNKCNEIKESLYKVSCADDLSIKTNKDAKVDDHMFAFQKLINDDSVGADDQVTFAKKVCSKDSVTKKLTKETLNINDFLHADRDTGKNYSQIASKKYNDRERVIAAGLCPLVNEAGNLKKMKLNERISALNKKYQEKCSQISSPGCEYLSLYIKDLEREKIMMQTIEKDPVLLARYKDSLKKSDKTKTLAYSVLFSEKKVVRSVAERETGEKVNDDKNRKRRYKEKRQEKIIARKAIREEKQVAKENSVEESGSDDKDFPQSPKTYVSFDDNRAAVGSKPKPKRGTPIKTTRGDFKKYSGKVKTVKPSEPSIADSFTPVVDTKQSPLNSSENEGITNEPPTEPITEQKPVSTNTTVATRSQGISNAPSAANALNKDKFTKSGVAVKNHYVKNAELIDKYGLSTGDESENSQSNYELPELVLTGVDIELDRDLFGGDLTVINKMKNSHTLTDEEVGAFKKIVAKKKTFLISSDQDSKVKLLLRFNKEKDEYEVIPFGTKRQISKYEEKYMNFQKMIVGSLKKGGILRSIASFDKKDIKAIKEDRKYNSKKAYRLKELRSKMMKNLGS